MRRFVVYEHQTLRIGDQYEKCTFKAKDRQALEAFYGTEGVPYFRLIHRGIRFIQFVGVLQIGNLSIEVLPKADCHSEENNWRDILIGMLKAVGTFKIQAPSYSSLQVKHNFILDLYVSLFIQEVDALLHKGLVKKYHKTEKNSFALKGNLLFGKHLQKNLVHKERFYVRQTVYDKEHLLHQILFQTILLLKQINHNEALKSKIGGLCLHFPEMKSIKVTEATFNKIVLNRKTESYKDALEIARLLLLNYHPDLKGGNDNVLALMFDMNYLWEAFIYKSLLKHAPEGVTVEKQIHRNFWQSSAKKNTGMHPDIILTYPQGSEIQKAVLDTKWKNIGSHNPSIDDLRQLYVYHRYYNAKRVALVYPGKENIHKGNYFEEKEDTDGLSKNECSVIKIETETKIDKWQEQIACQIYDKWLNLKTKTPCLTNTQKMP
jgi:5-methylcytosine-specific restriction enzyme subunit McrC